VLLSPKQIRPSRVIMERHQEARTISVGVSQQLARESILILLFPMMIVAPNALDGVINGSRRASPSHQMAMIGGMSVAAAANGRAALGVIAVARRSLRSLRIRWSCPEQRGGLPSSLALGRDGAACSPTQLTLATVSTEAPCASESFVSPRAQANLRSWKLRLRCLSTSALPTRHTHRSEGRRPRRYCSIPGR